MAKTPHCDWPRGSMHPWHRLIHSHSRFEVHLFQRGLLYGPQCLQRYTCSSVVIAPSEVNLFQHGLTHGCSPSRGVPALSWAYPWPHALRCSSMTSCTATDASRCTCCSMDLFTATDASGCPAPAWTHPQVTVPSTRVHTGVPACPVQQHKNSSDAALIGSSSSWVGISRDILPFHRQRRVSPWEP